MKKTLVFLSAALLFNLFGCNSQNETARAQAVSAEQKQANNQLVMKIKTPILVELFTSEGCSSCPPADRVLAKLENEQSNADAEIITLAFHVDYWNYLGWKDEFSSKFFSERQNGYSEKFKLDSIYTPQMVIDGEKQFVGSNQETALKAISDSAKSPKALIETTKTGERLKVKISDLPVHDASYIWLAIAEDNLKTNVRRGENSGKALTHVSVVRAMHLVGNLTADEKSFEFEKTFPIAAHWNKENLKFIVFVQGKASKKIFGVKKSAY